jgi:hypothetical protein
MAVQGATVQVKDFRLFMAALASADRKTQRAARDEIRKAGEHVRLDAGRLFATTDRKSAAGYRVRVRQRGVAVEQSLRRTTGHHPNYGGLQMGRALIPALEANEQQTLSAIEQALDRVCDRFNYGGSFV